MRLSNFEISSIKNTFYDVFKNGDIYVFGSRINDNLNGGDIDIFVDIPNNLFSKKEVFDKKIIFLSKLKEKIGEQKIDVIISINASDDFIKAGKNGIKL